MAKHRADLREMRHEHQNLARGLNADNEAARKAAVVLFKEELQRQQSMHREEMNELKDEHQLLVTRLTVDHDTDKNAALAALQQELQAARSMIQSLNQEVVSLNLCSIMPWNKYSSVNYLFQVMMERERETMAGAQKAVAEQRYEDLWRDHQKEMRRLKRYDKQMVRWKLIPD